MFAVLKVHLPEPSVELPGDILVALPHTFASFSPVAFLLSSNEYAAFQEPNCVAIMTDSI